MIATRAGTLATLATLVMLASSCASMSAGSSASASPGSSSSSGASPSREPGSAQERATSASAASPLAEADGLERLLRSDSALAKVLDEAERRRVQVLVAVPTADGGTEPLLRRGYRADADYFYPASAIKLAAAVAALEKLGELRAKRPKLTLATPLRIVSRGRGAARLDTTLGDELQKALVVSDNDSYNRLFDLVGPDDLRARTTRLGLGATRVVHHVGPNAGVHAARFEWRVPGAAPLVVKASPPLPSSNQSDSADDDAPGDMRLGSSYIDASGKRVNGAFDFSSMNRTSLRDLQELLVAVMRPELAGIAAPHLSTEDRDALIATLRTLPSELDPRATSALDRLHKPLLDGVQNALPGRPVRVYGKGGRAYGFTIVNAYVVDETTGRGVFVAAVVYSNDNDVINDDRYDYVKLGAPFFTHLGAVVARVLDSGVGG